MRQASAASQVSVELCVLTTSRRARAQRARAAPRRPRGRLRPIGSATHRHAEARRLGDDARPGAARRARRRGRGEEPARLGEDADLLAAPAQRRLGVHDRQRPHRVDGAHRAAADARTGCGAAARTGRRARAARACVPCSTMRPCVEHDDAVGVLDRRQPVRDHDASCARASAPRAPPALRARTRVSSARGRLVEDQDRRVLEDRARDRDALALPARQPHAVLADRRVEALRQRADEVERVRGRGGALDRRRAARRPSRRRRCSPRPCR